MVRTKLNLILKWKTNVSYDKHINLEINDMTKAIVIYLSTFLTDHF